jgi:Zn-dependent protease/predicted transcriptional regulator
MFEHSVTIFRVWGIPVRLHITLLLFLPYAAFVTSYQFRSLAQALGVAPSALGAPPFVWGIILAVGLFISILLHELAHVAIARRSGAVVRAITLMMLGGVSELSRDVRPEREALMAFAGPLASFILALVSYLFQRFVPLPTGIEIALFVFAWTNLVVAIFNLLPAFPMDGGRVLRGLLVKPLGFRRATRVATTVGRWMAVALGLYGMFTFNVLLILIAVFIYMGASAERARFDARDALTGLPVADLMNERIGEVHLSDTAGDAARRLLRNQLAGAKVVKDDAPGGATLGIVTSGELVDRAARGAAAAPVQSAMHTDLPTLHADDDASKTLELLARDGTDAVVVLNWRNEVIGLVTQAEIRRAVTLASLGGAGSQKDADPVG